MWSHGRRKLPSGCFSATVSTLFLPACGFEMFRLFPGFLLEHKCTEQAWKKGLIQQLLAHRWKDCVCVCVSLHWYCGERKVGLIFRVVDAALCSLSVSDLRTSSVHLASQLAVRVNARLTVPMPFYNLLGLRCVEACDTCGWLSNSHHFSFQPHLLNKKPTNIFRNNTSV